MKEIERKFLVKSAIFKEKASRQTRMVQGYLNRDPDRIVRIRICEHQAYMTIKGPSNLSGTTRFEWEKAIPVDEAEALLELCEPGMIEKVRYEIRHKGHLWEVDEFSGKNTGLVLAEIELTNEAESFLVPDWIGQEVTGDERYYNAYLSEHPYSKS